MAYIETRRGKNGATHYRVQVRKKGFPTESASFTRLTDARAYAQSVEAAMREGRYFKTSEAKRHTLGDLIERYLRDVLPNKPKLVHTQSQQFRWWKEKLGDRVLADVTPALLAEYRDILASEYAHQDKPQSPKKGTKLEGKLKSPACVNRYLAALSAALSVAVKEWGWLEDNPMRKVGRKREPRGRVRFLSDIERQSLLEACRQSDNAFLYPAVLLSLATGGRQSEVMGLRWADVDLSVGKVTFHETKNNERRSVAVRGLALEVLRQHAKVKRLDTDYLFPGKAPARPNISTLRRDPNAQPRLRPMDLRTPWETALKKAGIKDFRWHDLRHTAASYLLMSGATLGEIASVLGHKTLQMVQRYSHISEPHAAAVVERMNQKMLG